MGRVKIDCSEQSRTENPPKNSGRQSTMLGQDVSRTVAEAVQSRKRGMDHDGKDQPMLKRPAASVKGQDPSHALVLNTVASMIGVNSGGKSKVTREFVKAGYSAAGVERTLGKLEKEKAICYSPTKRELPGSKTTWRALRVHESSRVAANMFRR